MFDISGVPESAADKDLEVKVQNLFGKTDIEGHCDNTEAYHQIKSNAGPKRVLLKCCCPKIEIKFEGQRKKLKGLYLPSIGISSAVLMPLLVLEECLGKMQESVVE